MATVIHNFIPNQTVFWLNKPESSIREVTIIRVNIEVKLTETMIEYLVRKTSDARTETVLEVDLFAQLTGVGGALEALETLITSS